MIRRHVATNFKIAKTKHRFAAFIFCILSLILASPNSASAIEDILVFPDARYLSIVNEITIHEASALISVPVIRPAPFEKKSLTILSADNTTPKWISFSLTNPSKLPIVRLLVAPHYSASNAGLFMPVLSGSRIAQIYSSLGQKPKLQTINGNDIFQLTLPPEKTVTFLGRVADEIPTRLNLWDIDTYNGTQNYLPFYQGLLIGILGLFAILVSSLVVIRRDALSLSAAVICWAALVYSLQEFGFLTVMLPKNTYLLALIRALAEVVINSVPLILLYFFFNKNYIFDRTHFFEKFQWVVLIPIFIAALALIAAFISPSFAATLARLNAILVTGVGFVLIYNHWNSESFSTARTLLPIWVVFAFWTFAQIYISLAPDVLYLNLLVGVIYVLFLLMCFSALLQDFMSKTDNQYLATSPSLKPEPTPTQQTNISEIAIAGSGQVLWEWDLLKGNVKCGTQLDDLLNYQHGTMSVPVNQWLEYLHRHDAQKFEKVLTSILEEGNSRIDENFRLINHNGDAHWFDLRAVALTDDEGYLIGFVGTLNDVTMRKTSEDRLFKDAVHDSLTGLPNRSLFFDRLSRSITRATQENTIMPALLLVYIDRFKDVNDSIGIAAADSLLMTIASRIEDYISSTNTVARLNTDQFAIILTDYDDVDLINKFAEKIRELVLTPIKLHDREISLNASIGIIVPDNKTDKPDDLLQKAEVALNLAKQVSNNSPITFYSPALNNTTTDRFTRENDLRQAIARNEFEMLYQPIISLKTMRPVGFEALIRWHHPTEGDILPNDFIQLAEETGHIHKLGQFTLVQAAKQLNIWQTTFSHKEPLFVSVNMSSLQLFQPKLIEQVQDVLNRFNVIEKTLKLEVTESLVMQNPERARKILNALKEIGAGLAVDDFGTGYSSLAYLHHFPFDIIKIDRSFVSGENFGETRPIILKAVIQLARDLGLKVIAEGVEEDEQAHELINLGCEWVQGYRFGQPMSAKDSLNFLSANFT